MTLFKKEELAQTWRALPTEIKDTPLVKGRTKGLLMKLETLQPTGSYKIRAAYTKLKDIADSYSDNPTGLPDVALSSSGNFASAFTWAAARLGFSCHLVVTPTVNKRKMTLAQEHPCEVHTCGPSYESRFETLNQLATQGVCSIDHRTDREVFRGHATIGWECLPAAGSFDRVLVPVSTGGLALGVASALRIGGFKGEILGVQPAGNPTLHQSWLKGKPVQRPAIDTVCDALTATSVPETTFALLRSLLDDILLVEEESVLRAVGFLATEEGLVAEPGAAVGIASLLEGQRDWDRSLCIVSGRNLDVTRLTQCLKFWEKHKHA